MTTQQAAKILKAHNIWRRGADTEMTNIKDLGKAIDTVVEYFEKEK